MKQYIYCINIVCKAKEGSVYNKVVVNQFPIIYIDNEDVDGIMDDEELISVINKYIKNKVTYNNSELYIRKLYNNNELKEYKFRLKDKIQLQQWNQ